MPAGENESGAEDATSIRGEVEFKNVWFAYNNEDWVLKDVSFKVSAGETVAFVGATGAGKSTIINLINRFYDVNKGEILIDGIPVNRYNRDSLRKRIAVVLQDVFLFSDTIYCNITLGNPAISPASVREAAVAVGAARFIEGLPGGFDYQAGERGALLSMGQRQLISFIRAYVYKPAILVLDEATSSIDSESEALITRATRVLTAKRTSIVIAHRLSTIQDATRIILLDHGEIRESGTHQELLELGKLYYQLYRIQFGREAKSA
jgi:ATP-binding cassette subfamily B protein